MGDFFERFLNAQEVAAGWPRPRARCVADRGKNIEGVLRPVPWVALADADGWDPWAFDPVRGEKLAEDDLCQLCGGPRGATVFALATDWQVRARLTNSVDHFGGALCSLRCARLTAAVCPHFRRQWPVYVFEVAKRAREGITDSDHPTDDSYDLTGLSPVSVVGRYGLAGDVLGGDRSSRVEPCGGA